MFVLKLSGIQMVLLIKDMSKLVELFSYNQRQGVSQYIQGDHCDILKEVQLNYF